MMSRIEYAVSYRIVSYRIVSYRTYAAPELGLSRANCTFFSGKTEYQYVMSDHQA